MAEQFDQILSECIDLVLQGKSVEHCLQRYPEHAVELEPLLRVAADASSAASSIEPRPEFKAQARYQMQSLVQAKRRKPQARWLSFFDWVPRWAAVAACVVVVILGAGTGVVAASSNSLPGDTLYSVKLAAEEVQMAFTFSDTAEAELLAEFASRRVDELARIAEDADPETVENLSSRLGSTVGKIQELAAGIAQEPADEAQVAELTQKLWRRAATDVCDLGKAQGEAPDEAREGIAQARSQVVETYAAALNALEARHGR